MSETVSQEQAFLEGEADAWIRRNPTAAQAADADNPVLSALRNGVVGARGRLLDLGGAAGGVAAGFLREYPGWDALVVDSSTAAVELGQRTFPDVRFLRSSISTPLPESAGAAFDIVILSGVLCWVDRAYLSRAVAVADSALADGGHLVVCDFDAPFPRANPYAHRAGLHTYKQDYAACFTALGIYHVLDRHSFRSGSAADAADPYDRQWAAVLLRKDLTGRYARGG